MYSNDGKQIFECSSASVIFKITLTISHVITSENIILLSSPSNICSRLLIFVKILFQNWWWITECLTVTVKDAKYAIFSITNMSKDVNFLQLDCLCIQVYLSGMTIWWIAFDSVHTKYMHIYRLIVFACTSFYLHGYLMNCIWQCEYR